jgi:hypothetical protein
MEPPLALPSFTATVLWPEVLDADPGNAWLRRVVGEEARGIVGTTPL